MQFVFQMRYSYFGLGGWRSKASRDPAALFDTERLAKRAYFLEKIALASLAAQTDPDFKLVVLSSDQLPDPQKRFLKEVCNDMLGHKRVRVLFRGQGRAGNIFRRFQHNRLNSDPFTTQIVLDDDDAVSSDFVETLRPEAEFAKSTFSGSDSYSFVSQAQGVSAVFTDGALEFAHKTTPFVNLGLALVAPTLTKRNPFLVAHKNIDQRHPARVNYGPTPYYLRAVHDCNDSRAMFGDDMLRDDEMPGLMDRFPLLRALLKDHPRKPALLAAE